MVWPIPTWDKSQDDKWDGLNAGTCSHIFKAQEGLPQPFEWANFMYAVKD